MRSIASQNLRGCRSLGGGLLLLSLVTATPALAQPRRPAPEILRMKLPQTEPIQMLVRGPVAVAGRARECGTP